jgi:hypothetical protein
MPGASEALAVAHSSEEGLNPEYNLLRSIIASSIRVALRIDCQLPALGSICWGL